MMTFEITKRGDPFKKLPALAKRLGVKEGGDGMDCYFQLADGRKYSIFDLVNAVLDRLESK